MIDNPIKKMVSRREGVVPIFMIIAVIAVVAVAVGGAFYVKMAQKSKDTGQATTREAACPGDRGIACEVPKTPVCKDGKWICVGPAEPSGIIAPGVSGSGGTGGVKVPSSGGGNLSAPATGGTQGSNIKQPATIPSSTGGAIQEPDSSVGTSTPGEPAPAVEVPPPPAENIVIYTDDGFSPSPLTIKVGETVMFKNQGSRGMWVASDPHPTHTDDRDFDAHRGFGPDEVYSYTFTEAGTWGYHNHLNPGLRGKIIVQ